MSRLQSLSPPSPLSNCWIPSSADIYTMFENFDTERRYNITESQSADALTSSFDYFTPPQNRTSAKIRPGTFIVFALSTAELAQEYPEDSDVYRKICQYTPGRYLGLVTSAFARWNEDDDSTVEEVIVHFVSKDTPQPSAVANHCIPIFPVSTTEPVDSSALHTSILFPWIDHKQWTTFGVRLCIRQTNPSALVFELRNEDLELFENRAGQDYSRLESLHTILDDEAKATLGRLLVPPFAFPAEIWFDIRNHPDIKEPLSFVGDIDSLESIIAGRTPRDHKSSALDE
ncbi:uncharacterized protein F5147DRAFT_230379 [Suillus discolor]|uniref:Uncharacterized protein n=1 Tax=Suillus discolor TaxID=1912936 RepID=A0A9P7F3W8_9AGAM|nr:uncharacterized protein F5147DRAFT_230379 [Suillus discolor]KAG2106651.1 hypothetical protein F5147DRAFT_230379 [Suillus discolor]